MSKKYVVLEVVDDFDSKKIEFVGTRENLNDAKDLALKSYNSFWCAFDEGFSSESINFNKDKGGIYHNVDDEDFQYSIQIIEEGKILKIK